MNDSSQAELEQFVATAPLHSALSVAVHELRTALNNPMTRCRSIVIDRPELHAEMDALHDSIARLNTLMWIYFDGILYPRLQALVPEENIHTKKPNSSSVDDDGIHCGG